MAARLDRRYRPRLQNGGFGRCGIARVEAGQAGGVSSFAPSASVIWRESEGKAAWSPVSSINSVGAVTPGAHRAKSALELSPDQVDSQASGVVSRPKPVRP